MTTASTCLGALLLMSCGMTLAQADLGPRTPVEGGAIIMPEHAPPRRQQPQVEQPAPAVKPDGAAKKAEPPAQTRKKSREDDCKGNAALCKQDTAR